MSGQIITIEHQDLPRTKCPHCKNEILLDIEPWKKDVTKIMQDKCPKCGGVIIVAMMIFANADMKTMLSCIQLVADTVSKMENRVGWDKK